MSLLNAVILVALAGSLVQAEPGTEHVILVSIDGLRPDFYRDQSWPAPVLQEMARQGVAADGVRVVFPSVTYPGHATLVTGVLPARHGILYNQPFEPGGQTGRWNWEASAIRTPTLWEAAREAGFTTGAIEWPVTVGAPIDYVIPEYWSLRREDPPLQAMQRETRPARLWDEVEEQATGKLTFVNFTSAFLIRDDNSARAAAYIFETYRPALLALHLLGTDHFQHEEGVDGPTVRRAVAVADRSLGILLETVERLGLDDRTAFVVTGDHGFVNIHSKLSPNLWLLEAGLQASERRETNWRATFHTTGGSAFLRLRDPNDTEALEMVQSLLARLPHAYRQLFRVISRKELEEIGADPEAFLALSAAPGIAFTSALTPPVLQGSAGGAHGYFPDSADMYTGFVGFGAGFKQGMRVPLLHMEDVAPTIARLLGLQLGPSDGVVLEGCLEKRPEHSAALQSER